MKATVTRKQRTGMGTDFATGPVMPLLAYFFLPFLLANLLNSLYNIVDTVIIGHILDVSSMSADEVHEAVGKLRNASHIPMLVLTPLDAVPKAMEVGASECMPAAATDYAVFAQEITLIRRYTV